jgi:hypothetical protein
MDIYLPDSASLWFCLVVNLNSCWEKGTELGARDVKTNKDQTITNKKGGLRYQI